MMNDKEVKQLMDRYSAAECTDEEVIYIELHHLAHADQYHTNYTDADIDAMSNRVRKRLTAFAPVRSLTHTVLRYAAILFVALGLCVAYYAYDFHQRNVEYTKLVLNRPVHDVKAKLRIDGGQDISLHDHNGPVTNTTVSGVLITNDTTTGVVVFEVKDSKQEGVSKAMARTRSIQISTPPGGQYKVLLPDGTSVFINAASTITFPSRFAAKSREVSLIGEGYFEVAKNPNQPFIVNTADQRLTVLGTHFNVSAYLNETVKTTLAEGRVNLLQPSTGISQPLIPQQQALLSKNATGFQLKTVKLSDELAWKDGKFVFKRTPLVEAMTIIARWYDVKLDSSSIPGDKYITGRAYKNLTLSETLEVINSGSHYEFKLSRERGLQYISK